MFHLLRCLLAALTLALPGVGSARAETALEYQVKAAMLYNFTRFITWPEAGDVQLCLVGNNSFDGALEALSGKPAAAGAFHIQRVADAGALAACNMVFIGAGAREQQMVVLEALAGRPVLTVGEGTDFIQSGGVIQFILNDGKVRFAINPDAAERAGLRISSKLLGLATIQRVEKP
jgi:hypothetical protein